MRGTASAWRDQKVRTAGWHGEHLLLSLLPLAVIVPAGALAIRGSFDGLYGQDPFAYYDYAIGSLRLSFFDLTPPPPFFWPPGYPLLVALASLVVGPTPIAGQIVSLVAGALVPLFTALLAAEVWVRDEEDGTQPSTARSPVPLVAGLAVALTAQLWQSSVVVMADTAGLAAATIGVWSLARYGRQESLRWLVLAAAALAWAILTRWIYAVVAIPCAIYALVVLCRRDWRIVLLHGAAAAVPTALILGPMLLPALSGLLTSPGAAPPFAGSLLVHGWNPVNALHREFVTPDGYFRYLLPNGLYYALAPAHWVLFTPLLAVFLPPGLWAARHRRSFAFACLIVGWIVMVYAYHAGAAAWQNSRYLLAYAPPLAVVIAIGFEQARRAIGGRAGALVGLLLFAGLAWMASSGTQLTQSFVDRKQTHVEIVRWVADQTPPDSRLLTFGLTLTFRHYGPTETLELFELSPDDLAGLLADGRPTFLLLDVAGVEAQWQGRSPWVNYHWLLDHPGLVAIGQREQYALFRVGAPRS